MKETTEIKTIEELVQYTIRARDKSERYTLEEVGEKKYLSLTATGWTSYRHLVLTDDLAKQIDDIWTKREPYRQAGYTVSAGALSLQGILKRLGKTDISEKIKKVEQQEKMLLEKRRRNSNRKQIRETAKKLFDLMIVSPELLNAEQLLTPADLLSLVDLPDEE